jgi:hypothetical protein
VFFDAANIEYQYEPEGFEFDGIKYLPDFYIPYYNLYVEIKGQKPTEEEINKVYGIAKHKDISLFIGQPLVENNGKLEINKPYYSNIIIRHNLHTDDLLQEFFVGEICGDKANLKCPICGNKKIKLRHFHEYEVKEIEVAGFNFSTLCGNGCECVFHLESFGEDSELLLCFATIQIDNFLEAENNNNRLIQPALKARQARFEHGE